MLTTSTPSTILLYAQGPRDQLEDAARVADVPTPAGPVRRLIIADGMGGHHGGREAAQAAVELSASAYTLDEIADKVVEHVAERARSNRAGTTLSVAEVHDGFIHYLHTGDTALWLVWTGNGTSQIRRLTADHSMWGAHHAAGHPAYKGMKHILLSCVCECVAEDRELTWDVGRVEVPPGPGKVWVFGTSDGFHEHFAAPFTDDGQGGDVQTADLLAALRKLVMGAPEVKMATMDVIAAATRDNATVVGMRAR